MVSLTRVLRFQFTRNCEELQSQLSQSDTTRQETARRLRDTEAFSEKLRSQLDVESIQLKQGLQQLDENRSMLIAQTEKLSQQLETSYHQLSEVSKPAHFICMNYRMVHCE